MTENNNFEPAAVPEMGWGNEEDLVTDEEFASWVKRSQGQTERVLKEWDMGADASAAQDDHYDSVEFHQEFPDDEVVVFAIEQEPPRVRRGMRRHRSVMRRRNQQTGEMVNDVYDDVVLGTPPTEADYVAVTLPEELRDGGRLDLSNVVTAPMPRTDAYTEYQRQHALIQHIYERVVEEEPALMDATTIAMMNSTWGQCPHIDTGYTLKVVLDRPGAGTGKAQVRCARCNASLVSAPVSKIDVGYDD